jgi:DDE superfamily endonuclease
MKPTFAWLANGPIYKEQWTRQATLLIFCSLGSAMPLPRSAFSREPYGRQIILVPRVIKVDRNPAYPKAIAELKGTRELGRRCRCRPVRYLNNIVEQDHRAIKRRVRAMQGFRSFHSAWRTIQGIETVNMSRKGQIRWLPTSNIPGQPAFVSDLFAVAIAA